MILNYRLDMIWVYSVFCQASRYILILLAFCITTNVYAQSFTNVFPSLGIELIPRTIDGHGIGISFYDFNQDGWDDLSFGMSRDTQTFLINNHGMLTPLNLDIFNPYETKMILWVDYDDDGQLDLFYTSKGGQIKLFKNTGNLTFVDVTIQSGLSSNLMQSFGASFGDYDRDGDLDLYICKYIGSGDTTNLADVNNLYRNNGDGTFTDVTFSAGVSNGIGASFQSIWIDLNDDLWPDLFVINDRNNWVNALYINNQDGTFSDVANLAGVQMPFQNPMSASFADFDGDLDMDLYISNTSVSDLVPGAVTDYPFLFQNNADGTFSNIASPFNLELDHTTWGGVWLDYDNDMDQDLYIATDYLNTPAFPSYPVRNYFMINNYPSAFVDDSTLMQGQDVANAHVVARGDFNRDGFYDIAVHVDSPSYASLWENPTNSNNYVRITLQGTISNHFAIGASIRLYTGGVVQRQDLFCGESFVGQNSQHHLFGLAQHNIVDSVHVIYPSGIVDRYYNLQVNQSYLLIEGETNASFQVEVLGNQTFCEGDSLILQGPGALSYLWNTGDTLQQLKVFEEGDYRVSIIDSLGQSRTSDWVFINRIEQPVITTSLENISCFGGSDGSIELEVVNDGENFMVIWSDSSEGLMLDSLNAGTYTYRYLDEYGCELIDSIELSSPFPINAQLDIQNQTANQLGSIDFIINGGTPPYQIVLSNDTIVGAVDSLVAGFYFLQIMDYNSCTFSDTLEILFVEDTVINSIENMINGELSLTLIPGSELLLLQTQTQLEGSVYVRWFSALGKRIAEDELSIRRDQSDYRITYPNQLSDGLYFIRFDMKGVSKTFPILRKSK